MALRRLKNSFFWLAVVPSLTSDHERRMYSPATSTVWRGQAATLPALPAYGLPISEVISEGNVGLMQAVKRFEPEKGFRLATYAIWWIKAAIQVPRALPAAPRT